MTDTPGLTAPEPEPENDWSSRFVTPRDLRYTPGTLLKDAEGCFWLVRDDGRTAAGTNGGVMVDLRRGESVFTPEAVTPPEGGAYAEPHPLAGVPQAALDAATASLTEALRWEKVSPDHIADETTQSIAHAVVMAALPHLDGSPDRPENEA